MLPKTRQQLRIDVLTKAEDTIRRGVYRHHEAQPFRMKEAPLSRRIFKAIGPPM